MICISHQLFEKSIQIRLQEICSLLLPVTPTKLGTHDTCSHQLGSPREALQEAGALAERPR